MGVIGFSYPPQSLEALANTSFRLMKRPVLKKDFFILLSRRQPVKRMQAVDA